MTLSGNISVSIDKTASQMVSSKYEIIFGGGFWFKKWAFIPRFGDLKLSLSSRNFFIGWEGQGGVKSLIQKHR